jgi:uncharacterized protein YcbK (DUF882 family)
VGNIKKEKMTLTDNFKLEEFQCKCGCEMPRNVMENIFKLSDQLQILRDIYGSIHINSAYRCESHNESIGSNSTSQHILGKAADITAELTPGELADVIEEDIQNNIVKFGGLGRYSTFTHVDIRGYKARWDNTKK